MPLTTINVAPSNTEIAILETFLCISSPQKFIELVCRCDFSILLKMRNEHAKTWCIKWNGNKYKSVEIKPKLVTLPHKNSESP